MIINMAFYGQSQYLGCVLFVLLPFSFLQGVRWMELLGYFVCGNLLSSAPLGKLLQSLRPKQQSWVSMVIQWYYHYYC